MTLEEAIKHAEEVAEENQRVVDKYIVFGDVKIDMLYCDDTEVTEEHLVNCQMCAKEHRQLAEWLKDYKRLLEQEPKATGHWIKRMTLEELKVEAKNQGYKLVKDTTYEKFLPCKNCGHNRRKRYYGVFNGKYVRYKCTKCGYCVDGKTEKEAKHNWNEKMSEVVYDEEEDSWRWE